MPFTYDRCVDLLEKIIPYCLELRHYSQKKQVSDVGPWCGAFASLWVHYHKTGGNSEYRKENICKENVQVDWLSAQDYGEGAAHTYAECMGLNPEREEDLIAMQAHKDVESFNYFVRARRLVFSLHMVKSINPTGSRGAAEVADFILRTPRSILVVSNGMASHAIAGALTPTGGKDSGRPYILLYDPNLGEVSLPVENLPKVLQLLTTDYSLVRFDCYRVG